MSLKNDCVLSGIRFYNEICLLLQISHLGKEGKVRRIHPQGWVAASLKQIAAINPRHPKGLDDSMPISFVRMAAVSESNPQFDSLEVRKLGEVRKGFTHFAEGDVVFAKITPCMENGKGAVATGLQNGIGCGTTELHVIRPLGGVAEQRRNLSPAVLSVLIPEIVECLLFDQQHLAGIIRPSAPGNVAPRRPAGAI